MNDNELINLALEARENAYAPYSGFRVGAALLCSDGKFYTGCNIENASFSPTCCAERTAFFKAVSEGEREFEKIAVVGGKGESVPESFCTPCGVCRQVMNEFCNENFKILMWKNNGEISETSLAELLPSGFKLKES